MTEQYLSDQHRGAIRRGMRRYWREQPWCSDCGKVKVRRWGKDLCYQCKVKAERALG